MLRAEIDGNDKWFIVCPQCGFQLVGRRVEGLAIDGYAVVEVTKHGDDYDMLVELWNSELVNTEGVIS